MLWLFPDVQTIATGQAFNTGQWRICVGRHDYGTKSLPNPTLTYRVLEHQANSSMKS